MAAAIMVLLLQVIHFEEIQKKGTLIRENEPVYDGVSTVTEYEFLTKWGKAVYTESTERFPQGDDVLYCHMTIEITHDGKEEEQLEKVSDFSVTAIFDSNQKAGEWRVYTGIDGKLE